VVGGGDRHGGPTISAGDSGGDTGHLTEIIDSVALREGRSTRSNIFESCKSMLLYDAIRASAESGGSSPLGS